MFLPVALLVPVLMLALLIVGIRALVRSRNLGPWGWLAAFGLVVLMLLIGFGAMHLVTPRFQTAERMPAYRNSPSLDPSVLPQRAAGHRDVPDGRAQLPWKPGNLRDWDASIHPSARSAAEWLGTQIVSALPAVLPENVEPTHVQIYGDVEPEVLQAVASGLRGEDESLEVQIETDSPEPRPLYKSIETAASIQVSVAIDSTSIRYREPLPGEQTPGRDHVGHVQIQISGKRNKGFNKSASCIDKPWAEDFTTYSSLNPDRRWIVGSSYTACATLAEAEEQAIEDAVSQVIPLVRHQWAVTERPPAAPREQQVVDYVVKWLRNGHLIADRFTQSFSRPYGQIWRQEILVEVTPEYLHDVIQAFIHGRAGRITSVIRTILSAAGLVLLICVMYLFLNAVTKGYLTGILRFSAIVVIVLGVAVVLLVT